MCGNVAHIPKDERTVLGKRGSEQLDKLKKVAEEYFKKWGEPDWWPGSIHAGPERTSSSPTVAGPSYVSPALAEPEHAPTAPAEPERVSSISELMGPKRVSSISELVGAEHVSSALAGPEHASSAQAGPERASSSSEPAEPESTSSSSSLAGLLSSSSASAGPEHASSSPAPVWPDHGSMNDLQVLAENPSPSINLNLASPKVNWRYLLSQDFGPPPKRPNLASLEVFGQANKNQVVHVQPNPTPFDPRPLNSGPYDTMLPPGYGVVTAPSPNVGWPKAHVQQPNPIPWNPGPSTTPSPRPQSGPGTRVATGPSPNVGQPIILDFERYHPDLSANDKAPGPSNPMPPTDPGSGVATELPLNVGQPKMLDFKGYRHDPIYPANDKAPGPSTNLNPMPPTDPGYGVATAQSSNPGLPKEQVQQVNIKPFDQRPLYRDPYDAMLPPTRPGNRVVTAPLPNLKLPNVPIVLDFESYNVDAINPAMGKGKISRRHDIPGTARDGGEAAQRKLQCVLGR